MSFFTVVDRIRIHQCQEFRRYGSCGCHKGKKAKTYNPCKRAEEHANSLERIELGLPTGHTLADILAYLNKKSCRNRCCNHKGCAETRECCNFLEEQIATRIAA